MGHITQVNVWMLSSSQIFCSCVDPTLMILQASFYLLFRFFNSNNMSSCYVFSAYSLPVFNTCFFKESTCHPWYICSYIEESEMKEMAPSHTSRDGRAQTVWPLLPKQPSHHALTTTEFAQTKLFIKKLSNLEEWDWFYFRDVLSSVKIP